MLSWGGLKANVLFFSVLSIRRISTKRRPLMKTFVVSFPGILPFRAHSMSPFFRNTLRLSAREADRNEFHAAKGTAHRSNYNRFLPLLQASSPSLLPSLLSASHICANTRLHHLIDCTHSNRNPQFVFAMGAYDRQRISGICSFICNE